MKIDKRSITVGELYSGYKDSGDDGVVAFDGELDIRPPYQREFVYNPEQQKAVIDTVLNEAPLSIIYWAVREPDESNPAKYEVLDGQQRTLSIMGFLDGKFHVKYNGFELYFDALPSDLKNKILNYELMVFVL